MKESAPVLYPNQVVGTRVLQYADDHSTGLPRALLEYHEWILANRGDSDYTISPVQAKFLLWFARAIGAQRVLEIGVYLGFSSLIWAEAVGPSGKVTGLEYEDASAKIAREAYAKHKAAHAEVIVGDGHKTLRELAPSEPYDLVFIDADKPGYPDYLETLLNKSKPGTANRILRPGAIIMADNVLRRGLVADFSDDNPRVATFKDDPEKLKLNEDMVKSIEEFNRELASNQRLEAVLLPLYDGLGLARLID